MTNQFKALRCRIHGSKCKECKVAESSNDHIIDELHEELSIEKLKNDDLRVALIDISAIVMDTSPRSNPENDFDEIHKIIKLALKLDDKN